MFRERVGQAGGKEGGRQQPAAGQELEQPPGLRQPMPCSPPGLGPPGRRDGYFHRAGSPVSLVCIRESTTIYLEQGNKAVAVAEL